MTGRRQKILAVFAAAALSVAIAILVTTREELTIYLRVRALDETLSGGVVERSSFHSQTLRALARPVASYTTTNLTVYDALAEVRQLSDMNLIVARGATAKGKPCVSIDARGAPWVDVLREIAQDVSGPGMQVGLTMPEMGVVQLDLDDPSEDRDFELVPVAGLLGRTWVARYLFLDRRIELDPRRLEAVVELLEGGDWDGIDSLAIEGDRLIVYAPRERRRLVKSIVEDIGKRAR